eukprot:m.110509 g.110509  ORF g.110509 m.110509 type:complete len:507 (+) comp15916_c0_seq1:170-1690(+)
MASPRTARRMLQQHRRHMQVPFATDILADRHGFVAAAAEGNMAEITRFTARLLRADPSGHALLTARSPLGAPALYSAAANNHLAACRFLVETLHVDVNDTKKFVFVPHADAINVGATALSIACRLGHVEVAAYLIAVKADVNKPKLSKGTPLYLASQEGHIAVVELLLKARASVSKPRFDGATPLHIACARGHVEVVKMLVLQGKAKIRKTTQTGETPLDVACRFGSTPAHAEIVHFLFECGGYPKPRRHATTTPLLVAIMLGNVHVVRCLIDRCHVSLLPAVTRSLDAFFMACVNGHLEVAQFLAVRGAHHLSGQNPLAAAMLAGNDSVVQWLMRLTSQNWSPLMIALDAGFLDLAKDLLRNGPSTSLPASFVSSCLRRPHTPSGSCPSELRQLLQAIRQPWSPARHQLYDRGFRQTVVFMLMVVGRLWREERLPHLPAELWLHILAFLQRGDCDFADSPLSSAAASASSSSAADRKKRHSLRLGDRVRGLFSSLRRSDKYKIAV